jgi:hypothetical protein
VFSIFNGSMRLLLMIFNRLLLVFAGALFFLVQQLEQFGGFRMKDGKQTGAATDEAPNAASLPL